MLVAATKGSEDATLVPRVRRARTHLDDRRPRRPKARGEVHPAAQPPRSQRGSHRQQVHRSVGGGGWHAGELGGAVAHQHGRQEGEAVVIRRGHVARAVGLLGGQHVDKVGTNAGVEERRCGGPAAREASALVSPRPSYLAARDRASYSASTQRGLDAARRAPTAGTPPGGPRAAARPPATARRRSADPPSWSQRARRTAPALGPAPPRPPARSHSLRGGRQPDINKQQPQTCRSRACAYRRGQGGVVRSALGARQQGRQNDLAPQRTASRGGHHQPIAYGGEPNRATCDHAPAQRPRAARSRRRAGLAG